MCKYISHFITAWSIYDAHRLWPPGFVDSDHKEHLNKGALYTIYLWNIHGVHSTSVYLIPCWPALMLHRCKCVSLILKHFTVRQIKASVPQSVIPLNPRQFLSHPFLTVSLFSTAVYKWYIRLPFLWKQHSHRHSSYIKCNKKKKTSWISLTSF